MSFMMVRISRKNFAAYNSGMANSIWTTEQFTCPSCGMNYTATREELQNKHSGSFNCQICSGEVHAWSGPYDFFDWKIMKTDSPVFGKKK